VGGHIPCPRPLGQNWDFFTPRTKTGIFRDPSDTKEDFLPPRTRFFLLTPLTVLSNFTPSDSFSRRFTPLRLFGCQFYPRQTAFFTHFTPLGQFFFDNFAPLRHFLMILPPILVVLPPLAKNKDFPYPPGQGDLIPRTKRRFPPPPVFLME